MHVIIRAIRSVICRCGHYNHQHSGGRCNVCGGRCG
jgi:hypothetical protein